MKRVVFLGIITSILILAGCDTSHNFMDVDNPNAREDLIHYVGGERPKINTDDLVPDSLSGKWENFKGYANQYYEDTFGEYVDKAKEGLSGAKENLKGYYNNSVDELHQKISDKVNGVISGELNKFKIK